MEDDTFLAPINRQNYENSNGDPQLMIDALESELRALQLAKNTAQYNLRDRAQLSTEEIEENESILSTALSRIPRLENELTSLKNARK